MGKCAIPLRRNDAKSQPGHSSFFYQKASLHEKNVRPRSRPNETQQKRPKKRRQIRRLEKLKRKRDWHSFQEWLGERHKTVRVSSLIKWSTPSIDRTTW